MPANKLKMLIVYWLAFCTSLTYLLLLIISTKQKLLRDRQIKDNQGMDRWMDNQETDRGQPRDGQIDGQQEASYKYIPSRLYAFLLNSLNSLQSVQAIHCIMKFHTLNHYD